MKKNVIAMVVSALMAGGVMSAQAADVTVHGGTVNFVGEVVNAACAVSADSVDQTVTLSQVRTVRLATAGTAAGQKEDFQIKLADCDTTVATSAAVSFAGQEDANLAGTLANTAGAGAASHVALQLYGPDGKVLKMGDISSKITLIDGSNVVPLSVDYIATDKAATPGNVAAVATFNMIYS